jgi:nucleoside-diphosphate-sugar epimerase
MLVEAGHEVVGLTRSSERATDLQKMGARAAVGDVFDRQALRELVTAARPEIVVHQLSDLPKAVGPAGNEAQFAANVRMRTEGTRNLVDAALAAGARRVIAQSYAHIYAPRGHWVKTEDEPLNLDPEVPGGRRRNVEAIQELEKTVLETDGIEGVALRYGAFYGPGTPYARDGSIHRLVMRGRYPIVGKGRGLTSFVHVADAAAAVLPALAADTGAYNVVDDYPAPEHDWVNYYARLIGGRPPRHVFALVQHALGREHFMYRANSQRGASNAKAKAQLGLQLRYPSWREGFYAEVRREAEEEAVARAA